MLRVHFAWQHLFVTQMSSTIAMGCMHSALLWNYLRVLGTLVNICIPTYVGRVTWSHTWNAISNTLASCGLEEPAHTSRGLEEPFFQLCCCVSFWFWREIGFSCTYYYVLGVPYSCGVVLVFLVLAGNSFWCYVRTSCTIVHTQCTIQLCGCVSFFVVAGQLILFECFTVTIVSQKYWELSL